MAQETERPTDPEKGNTTQDVTKGDHPEPPQATLNQPSPRSQQGESTFGDSSGPIFSMYSKIAKEEDDQLAERWQKDADGILIFTGLFSAAVAGLLALSIQDLRPSSQDTSAFYLGNIYQVLANPNATSFSSPIAQPPPFSPPRYAVWVNSLWSLSLVISLVCALLATSLQQWARRFIRATQPTQCSPEKRARMRAFFAGGVDEMHLPWAVEALPFLIHVSLFLFFSGFIIFLQNINHSVYLSTISAIGLFAAVYVSFTYMPIFWPDSPYNTPFSSIAFVILATATQFFFLVLFFCIIIAVSIIAIPFFALAISIAALAICLIPVLIILIVCFGLLSPIVGSCFRLVCGARRARDVTSKFKQMVARLPRRSPSSLMEQATRNKGPGLSIVVPSLFSYQRWVMVQFRNERQGLASKRSPEIDLGVLKWTIGALGDDDTLEKFFEDIPGFFHSQTVRGLKRPLPDALLSRFSDSWGGFLARSLLSNSVDQTIKDRRLEICMKAITEICGDDGPSRIFRHLSNLRFDQGSPSISTVETLVPWCASSDSNASELARYTVAKVLPYVRERDDRWISFVRDVFGLPEHFLLDHIALSDDSVLLFILLCTARQVMSVAPSKRELLSSISQFDILNTLPELRNHFCYLWNEIVKEAKDKVHRRDHHHLDVLRGIRHLYIALHQGTDSAPEYFDASTPSDDTFLSLLESYPSCSIPTHRLSPTVVTPLPRLDGPNNPSPLPPLSESQPTPSGSTFPQQVIEVIDISPRELSSPDPITTPERIVPHTNPGQTSRTPAATLHTPLFSNAGPVIDTPLAVPYAPDNGTEKQGLPQSASATAEISSMTNQISQFILNVGSTIRTGDTSTGANPTPEAGSSSSIMSVFHSGTIPEKFGPSLEPALTEHDNIPRPLGSHLPTITSDISPQIATVVDAHATVSSSLSIPGIPINTRDITRPVSMEVSENPSVPPGPNIAEHTSALGDHQDD